jgi:hypothetical protein
MIEKTDSLALLIKNLQRIEILFVAESRIKAFNEQYQMQHIGDPAYLKDIKQAQEPQLLEIQQSIAEHVIISLATVFETYYKELLQQLLADYEEYFLSRSTSYSSKLNDLLIRVDLATYEQIEKQLSLRSRQDYYTFFKEYGITFLTPDEEEFIEYIYVWRNHYVHNAGRIDAKTEARLSTITRPFDLKSTAAEARSLRSKLKRVLTKLHPKILKKLQTETAKLP